MGERLRRHTADHDDHCTLTFHGVNWRIRQMHGLGRIAIEALAPDAGWALLDLSQADLDAYTDRAADWLRPDMKIANAEVLA